MLEAKTSIFGHIRRLKHSGARARGWIKGRAEGGRRRQNGASVHIGVGLLLAIIITGGVVIIVIIKVAATATAAIIIIVIIARQKFAIVAPRKTHRSRRGRLGLLAFGLRRRG